MFLAFQHSRVRDRVYWAAFLGALFCAPAAFGQPRPPTLCVETPSGCASTVSPTSYPWYPGFDLQSVPWHSASGAWGSQVRLEAPAAPSTTRAVTVRTIQEFDAAAAVPRTQITVAASWAGNSVATIDASDVDVIIPRGVSIGAIQLGAYPRTRTLSRIRIRGTTPGVHSGGRMGQYRDYELATDVIIDGIDLNGDSPWPGAESNTAFRPSATRLAILNVRAIAAGPLWLGGARHVFIGNSNLFHGAAGRDAVGFIEGWGIRNAGGPITIVDSRIQGTRYHNLRPQSAGTAGELLYATRSSFVAMAEGRTAWLWNNINSGQWSGQGAFFERNDFYTYSAPGCWAGFEIDSRDSIWVRISDNRFFGGGNATASAGYLSNVSKGGGAERNTFLPLESFPAWAGPGDPRQIPLPNGMSVISGEGQCPSLAGA